jgi:hypothetical protein
VLGMIFTEFSEMVEREYSASMLDDIIDDCPGLATRGAYTAVGSYDWRELQRLLEALSARTGVAQRQLLVHFGESLFSRLVASYPAFLDGIGSAGEFLRLVDDHVHVEVLKLYPQARLPRFEFIDDGAGVFRMVYRSERPLADLAEGLIRACIRHYNEARRITRVDLDCASGHACEFQLAPLGEALS